MVIRLSAYAVACVGLTATRLAARLRAGRPGLRVAAICLLQPWRGTRRVSTAQGHLKPWKSVLGPRGESGVLRPGGTEAGRENDLGDAERPPRVFKPEVPANLGDRDSASV